MRRNKKFAFDIEENGCFIVTSHKSWNNRYPQCNWNGKTTNIYKIIFEECFGGVPAGLDIRHKCDNKMCINPEHLHTGTRQDNVNDCIERGGWPVGEKSGTAKLNENDVMTIRESLENKKPVHQIVIGLSSKYNVSVNTIYAIHYKRSWRHLL